jgi:transcriptional regulator with XRE-family HTH domain
MQDDGDDADSVFNKRFGDLMRAAREEKDWSQRRLAELLEEAGVRLDPSAITRIERGSRDVKLREDEIAYSQTQRFRIEVAAFVHAAIQARRAVTGALSLLGQLVAVRFDRDTILSETGGDGLPEFFASAVRGSPDWERCWAAYMGKEECEILEAALHAITDDVLNEGLYS